MRIRTSATEAVVSGELGGSDELEPTVIVDRKALLPRKRPRARCEIFRIVDYWASDLMK